MSPAEAGSAAAVELTPQELADAISEFASDVKATDIVQIDLQAANAYTDMFVVCSGGTDRQAKAIHDRIHLGLKQRYDLLPRRVEGATESRWILMDYLDVVVHVFTPETREYYRLEALWGEVPSHSYEPAEAS